MRIGELARQLGVTVEAIRFYESENLLPAPQRTAGNYRTYGDGHVDRLRFIVNCRALDMTLDEIRRLLQFHDRPGAGHCGAVGELLDEHMAHLASRLKELRHLQAQLAKLRRACAVPPEGSCGILRSLQRPTGIRARKSSTRGV